MYLNTVLEIVTPQLFAQTYAEQNSISGYGNDIYCAFSGVGRFRIHAGGFVADDILSSNIKAASIIDIKAMMRGNAGGWDLTYRETVGAIVRKFKNILPAGITDQPIIDRIAEEALKRRRIFNACVCKSRSMSDLPGGLALRTNGDIGTLMAVGGASYLNSHDVVQLEDKLRKIGVNVKLPNTSVILIPYFSNAYTVSCIELIQGKRNSDNITVWLDNKEVALSCLLGLGDNYKCFMETQLSDVIKDMKRSVEDYAAFFSVIRNADGDGAGWLPKNFFYVRRNENPLSLAAPAALVRLGSSCVITRHPSINDSAMSGNSVTWRDAVADAVVFLLEQHDAFTPQVTFLLKTVRQDNTIKLLIKDRLEAIGRFVLSDQLETELRDGAIWEDPQGCLYSTPGGYLWEESSTRRLGGTLISNFTITPTYSVRYDTGEMYRAMTLSVGNETRDILLNPSSFDTTKRLSERIEETVALSGNPTIISPAIFDFVHSRPIITWLMRNYADLPIKLGTSYIGWNPTRTKFVGTGFCTNENGVDKVDCMYRPGIDYLRYFSSDASACQKSPVTEGVPMELMTLAWQCAGIIMRNYAGHTLVPVTYAGDKCTRESIQRVFSHAGQLRAVQLNKNMRAMGEIECIQGYPFVAQGYNRSQAKACKMGMILLGEEGAQIGPFTPEAEEAAGRYIRYIIETLPLYLIKNCGPTFAPSVGVIPDKALEEEGKKVIDEMEMNL